MKVNAFVAAFSVAATVALGTGAASAASAAPELSFQFLGSGQIHAPTDEIEIWGRITNSGGAVLDVAMPDTVDFWFGLPSATMDSYWYRSDAWPMAPDKPFSIGIGESLDWRVAILMPWPVTGNAGDPVPLGAYSVNPDGFSMRFDLKNPDDLLEIVASYPVAQPIEPFVWTVVERGSSVPEPATLAMLLGGLLAGVATQRHVRRRQQGDS